MQDYLCPLKTVEILVPAQGNNVEASEACRAEAVEAVAAAVEAVLAWAQAVEDRCVQLNCFSMSLFKAYFKLGYRRRSAAPRPPYC